MTTNMTRGNIYVTLDGVRGLAAMTVAVLHMPRVFAGLTLPNAHLAVDLFLQLSGFVIAHAYTKRIAQGMSLADFMLRRINRLYPMFLVGMLMGLPVALASLHNPGSGLSVPWTASSLVCASLQNFLMLPAVGCGGAAHLFPLNPPMWSVFYELLINLAFFFAVIWRLPRWALPPLAVALFWLTIALTIDAQRLDVGYGWHQVAEGSSRLLGSFLIGVIVFSFGTVRTREENWAPLLVFLLVVACLIYQTRSYAIELVSVLLIFPLLLAIGVRHNPRNSAVKRLCLNLGKLSYPLYVIHKPAYQLIYGAIVKYQPFLVSELGALLGVAILGCISAFAWYLADTYETAARRFMEQQRQRWLDVKAETT